MHKEIKRQQSGTSLVEQLATLSIAGMLVILSLPGLNDALDRHRIDSVAAQIESEMQFARSMAVAQSETVRVRFVNSAQGSCYVIHTGSPGTCSCSDDSGATCASGGSIVRHSAYRDANGVRLHSSAKEIGFDAHLGTVTPTTTLRLESREGKRVNLVMNVVGRLRSCSPTAGHLQPSAC